MTNGSLVIPKQRTGGFSNTVSTVTLDSITLACKHYDVVKKRLIDINNWGHLSNELAEFRLTHPTGMIKSGEPEEDDLIRINLPAPGTITSKDYEWVRIEYIVIKKSVMSDYESIAILVRPTEDPTSNEAGIAHFFTDDATSTFIVRRDNTTITAEVYGRNEKPNTEVKYIIDKLRNMIMGIAAILGFSKIQWKSFVNGLVAVE